MKIHNKKGTTYTIAGLGIGLAANLGVRIAVGIFYQLPADFDTLTSFGVAGMLMGAYFGYVISHFDYDSLFKHTKDKA